ncbi:hypothetical protein EVJ58_g5749 [Rhodofomes roseus]|uniref:Protein NO VEIN C-terminal domain-containing protein n=1 Tax=Rhodofomes roseus TaxID=34475 RepID=A0A4Y9YAH2_9APHY|nr:hypothetical protein EVJ58_g5749 [Rhodofomes roseus]
MIIRCNEKGFRADNVEAICDIGNSTKRRETRSEGYIGEKGIGFKAVFVVAERVHVASREFTFRFDRDGPLGMINPIWDATYPSDPEWTTFRLNIPHDMNMDDLRDQILTIQPSLLLFLRRLRAIHIDVSTSELPAVDSTKITISRHDESANIVRLECHENGRCKSSSKYIVFKQIIRTFTGEEKRYGIEESEVILAFPVTADGEPDTGNQFVHAFLPVAKYGLDFVVQADFLTPSNREGIVMDSKWNLALLEGIVDVFLHAVEQFQHDPVLRDSWVRFIPIHAQPPFSAVADKIVTRLQAREVLLSVDGRYRRPTDIVTVPKGFRISRTEPLIPQQYIPSVYYISHSYDASRDREYLAKLGVKPLSDQNFFDGLVAMDRANVIGVQSEQWHNLVCAHLSSTLLTKGKLDLRLIPLNDGSWRPAREAGQYVFMSKLDILQDVEFKCISNDVRENTARYTFLQTLGVRRADINLIATKILMEVKSSTSLPTLIHYARFFYDNRNEAGLPRPSARFKVMDENGRIAMSDELYLELPKGTPGHDVRLRDVLPSDARFLHRDYVRLYAQDRYWLSWLQDSLGLHTSPRIILGRVSPEIYSMAHNLETSRFLAALRAFWPQISTDITPSGLHDLSNIEVVCDDGVAYSLATTALKRRNLSWLPAALSSCLRFLPLSDPDDLSWSFLAKVGVTMEPNATAWIGMLFRLQEINSTDENAVTSVYQQLDARFIEAADFIRASFYQYPLILAPSDGQNRPVASWVGFHDAYWDGPSTLRSKLIVKSKYAALEDFFCRKLGLQNAPLEVLVDELNTFASAHEGRPMTEDTVGVVEQMLLEISQYIAWAPAKQFALLCLADRPIFPVHVQGEIHLQRIDQFFISEKGGKSIERFRDSVPLLAFSSAQTLIQLRPILDSNVWPSHPKVLEASLVAKAITLGVKTVDQDTTDLYRGRSEYMEKYVQHITKYCPSARQMEFLAKMKNTSICIVDTVIIMWILAGNTVNVQSDVKVAIEERETDAVFYVSKACSSMPRTRDREICSLLGDRVAIDKLALLQFVSMPWDDLLLYLEDEGVDTSTCIPQTTQESVYEQQQADSEETVPESRPEPSEPQYLPIQTNTPLDSQQWPVLKDSVQTSSVETPLSDPTHVQPFSPGRKMGNAAWRTQPSASRSPPTINNAHRRRSSSVVDRNTKADLGHGGHTDEGGAFWRETERDPANGVLGEIYRELGPNFTEANWTSELRGQVPGFTPYGGTSIADFRYLDKDGVLTGLWYGQQRKRAWKGRWPTYHVEVKTTSGVATEPFHVSHAQLQVARQFSNAVRGNSNRGAPQDVYVILRVSEIKSSQPKHEVYIDPHQWMYDGRLVIKCDVDLAPETQ